MRRNLEILLIVLLFVPGIICAREPNLLDSLESVVGSTHGKERIRILNILSEEHLLINPLLAESFALSALEEAKNLDLTDGILLSERNIALSLLQRDQYEGAFVFFNTCCDISRSSGNNELISSSLNGMGIYYTSREMYDSALLFFDRSIAYAPEEGLTSQLAMNYLGKGFIYRQLQQTERAVEYYNLALDLLDTTSQQGLLLEAYKEVGEFYLSAADIVNARETLFSALRIAESLSSEGRIAYLCYRLGYIHIRLGEQARALEYLNRSQQILLDHGEKNMLSEVYGNMGDVYFNMNRFDDALTYYDKGYLLRLEIGNDERITDFINRLGKAYALGGNHDKALEYYLESLDISEQHKDLKVLARTSLNIAGLYALKKRYSNALFYLQNALSRAEEISDAELIRDCHLEYSKIRSAQGYFEQALEHYRRYAEQKEDLIRHEKDVSLGNLNLNYQVLLKEQEIKQLEVVNVQNELAIQKQINLRNYFIFSTLLAILVVASMTVAFLINRRSNRLLKSKNAELEEANKKLVAFGEEMKKLNYTKDRLLSIISHDLRSPFNALIGFSDLLIKESHRFDEKQLMTFYKSINETSKKSFELLQNLLDWTRLQTSEIPFHPEEIIVAEMVIDSMELLHSMAENKEITLNLDVDPELRVTVDRKMFETVMRNLISNAIKYTPKGGKVTIGAKKKDSGTEVVVSDTGVGMSAEQIDTLFSVYEKVSTPGTNNEQGSGFGLVICREFVRKMGGELLVTSDPGEGSTFAILLP
jgi:signal transduction histidine kinase/uncharacterized protein HemY